MHDNKIEIEVAKPFNILSAYVITTATISPPSACITIQKHVHLLYPTKKPLSCITGFDNIGVNNNKILKTAN